LEAPSNQLVRNKGKSSHCELLAQATDLKHLSINQIIKERGCHEGYDEELKSHIVDEDKVPQGLFRKKALQ
jgi:broad-specificity NMP kinase